MKFSELAIGQEFIVSLSSFSMRGRKVNDDTFTMEDIVDHKTRRHSLKTDFKDGFDFDVEVVA